MTKTFNTLFENYSKCRFVMFPILSFSANFCPIESDRSGNTGNASISFSKKENRQNLNQLASLATLNETFL